MSNAANNLPDILTFSTCPRSVSAWTVKQGGKKSKNTQKNTFVATFPDAVVLTLKLNAGWQRDVGL